MNAYKTASNLFIKRISNAGRYRFASADTQAIAPVSTLQWRNCFWTPGSFSLSLLFDQSLHKQADTPGKPIADAMANPKNPRTIPRAAVWIGTAAIVSFFGMRLMDKAASADNKNIIQENPPPQASTITKRASETLPIVMNADKYKTLHKKGLGVKEEED